MIHVFFCFFHGHSPVTTRGAARIRIQLRVALGDILAMHLVPEPAALNKNHTGLSSKYIVTICNHGERGMDQNLFKKYW